MNREENRNQIILYEKKSISNLKKRIEYCTLRGSVRLQNELLGSLVVNREDKWLGLNMGAKGMIGKRKTGGTGQLLGFLGSQAGPTAQPPFPSWPIKETRNDE